MAQYKTRDQKSFEKVFWWVMFILITLIVLSLFGIDDLVIHWR